MYYGNIKKTDIANGTGVRVSLFVSGCRRHCKDCFNSETWDFCYGNEFTDDTMNEIITAMDKEYIKVRGSENQRIINVKKSLEDKTVTELTEGEYDEY